MRSVANGKKLFLWCHGDRQISPGYDGEIQCDFDVAITTANQLAFYLTVLMQTGKCLTWWLASRHYSCTSCYNQKASVARKTGQNEAGFNQVQSSTVCSTNLPWKGFTIHTTDPLPSGRSTKQTRQHKLKMRERNEKMKRRWATWEWWKGSEREWERERG